MTALPGYIQALQRSIVNVSRCEHEQVALADAAGRVLADEIVADRDLPPFNRSQLDGYTLRAAEFVPGRAWPVAAIVSAGSNAEDIHVPPGSCVAIATGAPLPAELDAVIQHELSDRGDPVQFTVESVDPWRAVHRRSADAKAGAAIIGTGTLLAAHHIGIAAAVGRERVTVAKRPRVIVLTSGDEIIGSGEPVEPHQIRNSNGPMLRELVCRCGGEIIRCVHISDDRDETIQRVGAAVNECDLVLTVGGVSAGDRDHFPVAFERNDVETLLRGVAIQPGKPIFVGRAPTGCGVVGLPGNPVSALVCAHLFVWPMIRTMLGLGDGLPWRPVRLADAVSPNPHRQMFRPAVLRHGDEVAVPAWAGSGDLVHTAQTLGLIELPKQQEPVLAGETLPFLPWA